MYKSNYKFYNEKSDVCFIQAQADEALASAAHGAVSKVLILGLAATQLRYVVLIQISVQIQL